MNQKGWKPHLEEQSPQLFLFLKHLIGYTEGAIRKPQECCISKNSLKTPLPGPGGGGHSPHATINALLMD